MQDLTIHTLFLSVGCGVLAGGLELLKVCFGLLDLGLGVNDGLFLSLMSSLRC